jgi:hypothetical protein
MSHRKRIHPKALRQRQKPQQALLPGLQESLDQLRTTIESFDSPATAGIKSMRPRDYQLEICEQLSPKGVELPVY